MPGSLVRSVILDGAAELAAARGVRAATLARRVGLPLAALRDPDLLVPAAAVLRFFELAATACRMPDWGLTLARGGRLAAVLGPMWVLLRNARNVRQMCDELADNFDLYTDAALVGVEQAPKGGVLLSWSTTAGQHVGEVQMAEFAMCVFAKEIRTHLRPDWMPSAVLFRHAPPRGSLASHRAAFGSDPHFNQDRNALLLDRATLDAPLKRRGSAARALASHVVRFGEEQLHSGANAQLAHHVEAVVRSLMPYAPCTVEEVSRALDVAPRTLQLRLKRQGTSLTQVREAVRADLAAKYLRHSSLSATAIAELLGYADPTSFSRSFRRWNGECLRKTRSADPAKATPTRSA
jgi:AraC-like DNA-binding protein